MSPKVQLALADFGGMFKKSASYKETGLHHDPINQKEQKEIIDFLTKSHRAFAVQTREGCGRQRPDARGSTGCQECVVLDVACWSGFQTPLRRCRAQWLRPIARSMRVPSAFARLLDLEAEFLGRAQAERVRADCRVGHRFDCA